MLQVGEAIAVKTKTKDDVFGDVMYEITETGLACPHCKGNDGIKFLMLGGTGPSARKGIVIVDCEKNVKSNMATGITHIISVDQLEKLKAHYAVKKETPWQGKELEI